MKIKFDETCWNDYIAWLDADRKVFDRINELIKAITRDPFKGIGKPEGLKGVLAGWWSRRITEEHRLTYRLTGKSPDQTLEIIGCRHHYSNLK